MLILTRLELICSKRRDHFSVAPFFLRLVWQNADIIMAKTKKDTNARVARRRKQTKESKTEQLCMNNIPMDLNESDDLLVLGT